jgi:dolichol-phosphate mannosyltransferase
VSVLIVLPTYNEAENVLALVREILTVQPSAEVLVVDDASPDGTGRLVAEAMRSEPRLHLVERPAKLGLGTAYVAGFGYGIERGHDLVVTMDCDYSHPPRYLPALIAGMADHDLMIGSRYVPGGGVLNWPLRRRALSSWANFYTRTLLRMPVRDCTAGFRCYRRVVLETVDPSAVRASGYSFLAEMAWRVRRAGFRIGETPILFEERRLGTSKISKSEIWRAAVHVLRTALDPPPVGRRPA